MIVEISSCVRVSAESLSETNMGGGVQSTHTGRSHSSGVLSPRPVVRWEAAARLVLALSLWLPLTPTPEAFGHLGAPPDQAFMFLHQPQSSPEKCSSPSPWDRCLEH